MLSSTSPARRRAAGVLGTAAATLVLATACGGQAPAPSSSSAASSPASSAAAAPSTSAAASAAASSSAAGSAAPSASGDVDAVMAELTTFFDENEADTAWETGKCADVYTRMDELAGRLAAAADGGGETVLAETARTMGRQARAVHDECDLFESEEPPAQMENRYLRVDMQLWKEQLAFVRENPDNAARPTQGSLALSTTALPAELADRKTYRDCEDQACPEFLVVPTGSFQMGGDAKEHEEQKVQEYRAAWESPKHEVTIGTRYGMATTEVTRGQFRQFVEDTGYEIAEGCVGFPTGEAATASDSSMWRPEQRWDSLTYEQTDEDPVVCVSRHDAEAYAAWLSEKTGQNYRLPSEAEWEYAARGGTQTAYFWGDDVADGCEYAAMYDERTHAQADYGFDAVASCDDGHVYTAPVGSFKPNPWGLFDVTGNAREWVSDVWEPNLESGPVDEKPRTGGVAEFPVLRGGAWDYMPQNERIAYRSAYYNDNIRSNMWGFRLVREL